MTNQQAVSIELHHEITQFLYKEARMLDNEQMRDWLTNLVAPEILYQMVVTEERFRKDKSSADDYEVMAYDDAMGELELRVKHYETGLQGMMDPPQRLRRIISNVEAFEGEKAGEYTVLSYGVAYRFRRQYEHEQVVYTRKDVLKRDASGALRIAKRRVDIPERVVRNKNLLFFL